MTTLRPAAARGHLDHGWLDARHSFSFGHYHDPEHMGAGVLRVINEDRVAPGQGFPTHGHRDMEIITYIISGALAHRDSMGNVHELHAGEVQAMSAGTGITHSEFNASETTPVHLLQMWIIPHTQGVTPQYAEWKPAEGVHGEWSLVVSGFGEPGALPIHQNARLWLVKADAGATLHLPPLTGKTAWLQVAEGVLSAGAQGLEAGDGLRFTPGEVSELRLQGSATLLLFDLP